MTEVNENQIPLIEGPDAPPDVELKPVDGEGGSEDAEMKAAEDLSEESYKADDSDDKGLSGLCG